MKIQCVTCATDGIEDCVCASNKVMVEEYNATGVPTRVICEECPDGLAVILESHYNEDNNYFEAGRRFFADKFTCQACPDTAEFDKASPPKCKCNEDEDFELAGIAELGELYCSHDDFSRGSGGDVFEHYFQNAATKCKYFHEHKEENYRACQSLANLCVLHHYEESKDACDSFKEIGEKRVEEYNNIDDWKEGMPWLYFESYDENSKDISMEMSFSQLDGYSHMMKYKLAKYRIDGTLVSIEDLDTQLSYCRMAAPETESGGGHKSSTKFLKFGTSQRDEFQCDLRLLVEEEMFFYDLYVVDEGASGCEGYIDGGVCMYPVAVLNRNYVGRGGDSDRPNEYEETQTNPDYAYTRRFYLFDNLSTKGIIKYATKIILRTQIQEDKTDKIYPPTLTIEYGEKKPSEFSDAIAVDDDDIGAASSSPIATVMFKVEYTMNTVDFWYNATILIGFLTAVAGMIWMIRVRNWQNRTSKIGAGDLDQVGMIYMVHVIMLMCHSFVVVFFPFTFCMCAYWFVFFKLQDTVFILMPADDEFLVEDNEYYYYIAIFHALFWTQTIYLLYKIYQQCNTDIFLVDWEKSKSPKQDVSVWRTLMVANEWNEMQTQRKTSIEFSLFWIGFFLIGLDLQNNATSQPNIDDVSDGYINPVLRFCNITWWFFLTAAVQWIWQFAFYERYYKEPRGQVFIDLCTIAKVSVFIMDEPYHGFYLHCRSPYEFADGSMMQLTEQLKKEESGLTTDRGLDAPGAPRDCQAFELFTSPMFRGKFNKVYSSLHQQNSASLAQQSGRLGHMVGRAGGKGRAPPPERMVEAVKELNGFLQSFVEQSPPPRSEELKRIVREPPLLDRLMGNPPADIRMDNAKCIFYPDNKTWLADNNFLRVVFLGIETDLWIHNVLTFNIFDLTVGNTSVSILMTYLMHLLLVWLRGAFGQANVANKTLVDDRFLI